MKSIVALSLFALLGASAGHAASGTTVAVSVKAELKCSGDVISSDNAGEVHAYLQEGLEQAVSDDYIAKLEKGLLSDFLSAVSVDLERRILFLQQYEDSGFSADSAAAVAKALGTSDMCGPGYACGAGSVGNSSNCSGCGFDEITPRTTPRTCNYSCTMCCAYYGNPAGCVGSCAPSDPC
ncbi:MAG TPA: hypothetical protein VF179_21090 [Thermoanaerobaculia bacterium]|nr:hypothetical protein [Thermoanaerobaculia bacterium]